MNLAALVFYVFAFVLLFSGVMVISARNPVHCVLFLILAFFNAAGLFLLLGAEYLAMTLIIVYVGAVAVLFLFVIMMMDINFAALREGFMRYLPVGASVAIIFFVELMVMITASLKHPTKLAEKISPIANNIPNTQAIGNVLYTHYIYLFQVAGFILLASMVGAIVLTHRSRPGTRKQVIAKQVARKRSDALEIVKVQSGRGI